MQQSKFLILLFSVLAPILWAQTNNSAQYQSIRSKYENLKKNDTAALVFVKQYIKLAKAKNDYPRLVQAYKDAVLYTDDSYEKLKYADSTIAVAHLSNDSDLISSAYLGKGIVYYFNYRKYKLALDEYLKAYQYTKSTKDLYLHYKLIYHMGVVKSFLGYNDEALQHFQQTISYFENELKKTKHPNLIYNDKRAYYNCLHQLAVIYSNQTKIPERDSILKVVNTLHVSAKEFPLENAYFIKTKAIAEYNAKYYNNSIKHLQEALPALQDAKDYAWISLCYFYLGKNYLAINDKEQAMDYFAKVDQIFEEHQFLLPEAKAVYVYLIADANVQKDTSAELYYTKQLLKADSILSQDYNVISQKMHKGFDSQELQEKLSFLEKINNRRTIVALVLATLSIITLVVLILRIKKETNINKKYKALKLKLEESSQLKTEETKTIIPPTSKKNHISNAKYEELENALQAFEKKLGFRKKSLTQSKLAEMLNTNTSYLSNFINDTKGVNYTTYIKRLRINYITSLLNTNPQFLKYTVETLAEECGMSSRQNFSDAFIEINGIRPIDFIRKKKSEIESQ
ncbi:helix-turn-helix domain-containing protein, partial [Soonwooa sp.]|uniref:helix-turn-helix domain-containing protein n=1 Tax=Soonwooa sp. TaxID=1938592 RepID=UPI00289EE644